MSTPNPTHTDVIAKHADFVGGDSIRHCSCGRWHSTDGQGQHSRLAHAEHVVSKLTDAGYSIVELPAPYPDDTVHPYWVAEDTNGPQLVRVTDSDEGVEGNWVGIEFSARYRTLTRKTARELGLALLAAAATEGEKP